MTPAAHDIDGDLVRPATLQFIWTRPDFPRRGHARLLVEYLLKLCPDLSHDGHLTEDGQALVERLNLPMREWKEPERYDPAAAGDLVRSTYDKVRAAWNVQNAAVGHVLRWTRGITQRLADAFQGSSEVHGATAFVLAPFFATLAILGLAGHGLPRWLSYASAVLSLAFALGGAAALFWYGAFLGLLLWIVAVCVVAIAGEKLSAKAPETLTLLG